MKNSKELERLLNLAGIQLREGTNKSPISGEEAEVRTKFYPEQHPEQHDYDWNDVDDDIKDRVDEASSYDMAIHDEISQKASKDAASGTYDNIYEPGSREAALYDRKYDDYIDELVYNNDQFDTDPDDEYTDFGDDDLDEEADYDYGHRDYTGPKTYKMDVYDYKGRPEHTGTNLRIVNNYGDNPIVAEDEIDEEFLEQPDYENDAFIRDNPREGYDVSCCGSFVGTFSDYDEALAAAKSAAGPNYFPSIWFVDDHGGVNLINEKELEELKNLEESIHNEYKLFLKRK